MKTAIIIPTYNRPELLQRAVDSAFNQTRRPDEIIVVNDGDAFQISWRPGLKVLHTKGGVGPTIARNIGIRSTNCEIICYLDDDDELLPNHVELLTKAIEAGNPFAFSKARYKYANGFETEDPEPNNHNPDKKYYEPTALLRQNIAPISSFAHSRSAWSKIEGWDEQLVRMEDWDFWGRLFIQFGPPVKIDEVTNVIYKGLGSNRTDSNKFVYSMGCSWGDVVRDRLKKLAELKHGRIANHPIPIPKVGVILPVYNAEKFLAQSIESLLTQTFKDFEIIAIDDCSTDSSREILNKYAAMDPRVRIFSNTKNLGVTKTLNHGLLMSRSIYIARMDADDLAHSLRLEKQVNYLDANKDVYVLGTCFDSVTEDLSRLVWHNDVEKSSEDILKVLPERCCIGHPTVMMRRKLIETIGGYSEAEEHKAVEDYELWLRASKSFKLANLPEFLLLHRTHSSQVSSVLSDIQKQNSTKLKEAYRRAQ